MLLWFAGLSVLAVWKVFQSPAIDYRFVVLGSVLPVAEFALGGPRLLHTLVGAVATLVVVMLATRNRRLLRRQMLGLPIGLFMHLVLDGVWADTHVFWWPWFGGSFGGARLPELARGLGAVPMELAGAAALVYGWKRFGLVDPQRRATFLRTGRIDQELVP